RTSMSDTELKSSPPQTSFAPPDRMSGGPNGRDGSHDLSIREISLRVASRRWLLLGIAAVTFAGVAIWTFMATPRYRSEARLRIETQSQGSPLATALSDQASSLPGGNLLSFGRDELETEIGVLRSDRISDATIDTLALGMRVTSPAASRARILSART